jgi:hypothetical protein
MTRRGEIRQLLRLWLLVNDLWEGAASPRTRAPEISCQTASTRPGDEQSLTNARARTI